jgi:hypothetical protein
MEKFLDKPINPIPLSEDDERETFPLARAYVPRDPTKRYVSIWQEELEHELLIPDAPWLAPKPYFVAKQRATSYYRQFTRREMWLSDDNEVVEWQEVKPDAFLLGESNFLDANLSPESRVLFNDLVRQLLFNFVKEFEEEHKAVQRGLALKFVSRLVRMSRLDEILDEDLKARIQESLGDANPLKFKDLATLAGFKSRDGGRYSNDIGWQFQRISEELRVFTKTMV